MDVWFTFGALLAHVLAMSAWVGGLAFFNWIVYPAVASLPVGDHRRALGALGSPAILVLRLATYGSIVFGAASGIALRRTDELVTFQTRWGWTIVVGASVAMLT